MKPSLPGPTSLHLVADLRQLIEISRAELAVTVNSTLTLLYWQIGQRIHSEVFQGERAGYGEQVVLTLPRQLETDYGRGFSGKNLRHMLRFAQAFPDADIVSAVRRQLSWTHIKTLMHVAEHLTELPSKALLQQKLHQAITLARQRLNNRSGEGS